MARYLTKSRKRRISRKPVADQCCLRSIMPTSGSKRGFQHFQASPNTALTPYLVKYKSEKQLTHDVRRDKRVADALEAAGYKMLRRSVSHAFADMFRIASPIVSSAHSQGVSLWDILPLVQGEINWAGRLPEAIFFELFTCLIEARCEWQKNPETSSRPRDTNQFLCQIDAFRRNVGDCPKEVNHGGGEHASWILVDAVFFNELAGGLDLDENEEGEGVGVMDVVNAGDVNGDEYITYPGRGCCEGHFAYEAIENRAEKTDEAIAASYFPSDFSSSQSSVSFQM
ncbi:hypothetical protein F4824DRAFT_465947 [Ustulina deusta]|nr:hypothetical protein F4824DRAFT_465947 [Ustulina deusta]